MLQQEFYAKLELARQKHDELYHHGILGQNGVLDDSKKKMALILKLVGKDMVMDLPGNLRKILLMMRKLAELLLVLLF